MLHIFATIFNYFQVGQSRRYKFVRWLDVRRTEGTGGHDEMHNIRIRLNLHVTKTILISKTDRLFNSERFHGQKSVTREQEIALR